MPPTVSVLIPAYNAAPYIAEAVDSVLAQTFRDCEVIVVNDGSTDDTGAVLDRFGSSIRVITHHHNRGLVAARQSTLDAATGEFVAFLDADDLWHPDKLSAQIDAMRENPAAGLVHTGVLHIDASGAPLAVSAKPWHQHPMTGDCTAALVQHNTITTSSVLAKRQLVAAYTAPRPYRMSEDWAMWLFLSLLAPFAYVPAPLTTYRRHGANTSSSTLGMIETSLQVLEDFSRNPLIPVISPLRDELRTAIDLRYLDLAHLAYEAGDMDAANALFKRGIGAAKGTALIRFALSSLPVPVSQTLRKLLGRS